MNWMEIMAVVFSLLSVYLSTKKNVWCWITGNVGVVTYFILFLQNQLYADMGLQVVYFIQGGYGIYHWWIGKPKEEPFVSNLSNPSLVAHLLFVIIGTVLVGWLLDTYTSASSAYVDALASLLSLTANWLLAKRQLQNWYFWIAADLVLIGLFWHKQLYLSSAIYILFLLLCIKGYRDWKRNVTKEGLS